MDFTIELRKLESFGMCGVWLRLNRHMGTISQWDYIKAAGCELKSVLIQRNLVNYKNTPKHFLLVIINYHELFS